MARRWFKTPQDGADWRCHTCMLPHQELAGFKASDTQRWEWLCRVCIELWAPSELYAYDKAKPFPD